MSIQLNKNGAYSCPVRGEGFNAMRKPRASHMPALQRAGTLHNPVLPRVLDQIRSLVNATYARYGGMGRMTLDEWRDLEQELKRKMELEHP